MSRSLCLLLITFCLAGCSPRSDSTDGTNGLKFRYEGIMGTYASMTFWLDEAEAREAAEATMTVFREVNDRFSVWTPDSELSKLNASAYEAPFACSAEMWDFLIVSREAYELSEGAFDISAGPLMKLWGFHRKRDSVPSQDEIEAVLQKVGLDKVIFDKENRTVRFTVEGMELDSGGIAKGMAVDQAADRLVAMGVTSGLIDLGGNIYCLGEPPPGRETYTIGVRNPRQTAEPIGAVPMLGQAIATSGDYERYVMLDGKRFSHIMDPRTGYPVEGMASVTVIAPRGVVTDYLSTAIFVNRGTTLEAVHAAHPDAQILLVTADQEGTLSAKKYGDIWNAIEGETVAW